MWRLLLIFAQIILPSPISPDFIPQYDTPARSLYAPDCSAYNNSAGQLTCSDNFPISGLSDYMPLLSSFGRVAILLHDRLPDADSGALPPGGFYGVLYHQPDGRYGFLLVEWRQVGDDLANCRTWADVERLRWWLEHQIIWLDNRGAAQGYFSNAGRWREAFPVDGINAGVPATSGTVGLKLVAQAKAYLKAQELAEQQYSP